MHSRLQTKGTALAVTGQTYPLTAGMAGIATAEFITDPLWAGLALTAVFSREGRSVLAPLADGRCTVPHEMLAKSGTLYVGLVGTDGERTLPSVQAALTVVPAVPTDASAAEGEEASVLATEAGGALHLAFTLPRGADGETPRRGVDYWTDEDIAAVRGYVDDAILGGVW